MANISADRVPQGSSIIKDTLNMGMDKLFSGMQVQKVLILLCLMGLLGTQGGRERQKERKRERQKGILHNRSKNSNNNNKSFC